MKIKKGVLQAHLFINDFVLTQLVDEDINEIWAVGNPMGALCAELKAKDSKAVMPVSRLLWSTGANSPTAAFVVGLYVNERLVSKGSGETVDVAEEMAARDALRRLFGTVPEQAAPLPFGQKARQFANIINTLCEKLSFSSASSSLSSKA
jgi:large subunit ribosomal protein L44